MNKKTLSLQLMLWIPFVLLLALFLWMLKTNIASKGELAKKNEELRKASAASDHTVKVDVTDLTPGETYYYRFSVGDTLSPVGRTKTLPAQTERARFAVISCSHYAFGYYHVYREISALDDLDAVVHLGDYIYEYGRDGYGGAVGKERRSGVRSRLSPDRGLRLYGQR